MSFAGRVALVTGAGSGIGAALGRELGRRGARVLLTDREADPAAGVAALDVTRADDVEACVADVVARHGRIDLLFNNAGIAIGGETQELSASDWQRVLDVNLGGVVNGVRAAYPRMLAQGDGHIVNVASVAGLVGYALALPYTTSKHAVVGLSTALRAEAATHGVRVSVACPGAIDTAIWTRAELRGPDIDRQRLLRLLGRFLMSADRCATEILDGVAANRGTIVVTAEARLMWRLHRISPVLSGGLQRTIATLVRRFGH